MTSKHCFFKFMKEDLKQKVWMIALSCIGSVMAVLVAYLFVATRRSLPQNAEGYRYITYLSGILSFFSRTLLVTEGIITYVGALIVGIFGLRYLYRKNMVDLYHGIPVKRSTLFLVNWFNGFLIWLVPFLVTLLITAIIGVSAVVGLQNRLETVMGLTPQQIEFVQGAVGTLILRSLKSTLLLILMFFILYHFSLLVVMFCGNLINVLVSAAVMGVGVISLYGLSVGFASTYLDTFVDSTVNKTSAMAQLSPLVSPVYLISLYWKQSDETIGYGVIMVLIACVFGFLAWLLYQKRPSELAEQGMKNRPVKFVIRTLVTLCAAMGGWIVFAMVFSTMNSDDGSKYWGMFGALFVGVLAFGIMEIVFEMDFKAFFRHKAGMVVTIAVSFLFCLSFSEDWYGYDTYLPDQEDIAGITLYDSSFSGFNYWRGDILGKDHPLQLMTPAGPEEAYTFLSRVAGLEEAFEKNPEVYEGIWDSIDAKVTLKNGKTYYRQYRVNLENRDCVSDILLSDTYLEENFVISEEEMQKTDNIEISGYNRYANLQKGEEGFQNALTKIISAYNQELEENREILINPGPLLCTVSLHDNSGYVFRPKIMYVGRNMSHVVSALEECGFERFLEDFVDVAELKQITIHQGEDTEEVITDPGRMQEIVKKLTYDRVNTSIMREFDSDWAMLEYKNGEKDNLSYMR